MRRGGYFYRLDDATDDHLYGGYYLTMDQYVAVDVVTNVDVVANANANANDADDVGGDAGLNVVMVVGGQPIHQLLAVVIRDRDASY